MWRAGVGDGRDGPACASPPNDFAEAHWLLDYRFGFVRRGLAGSILGEGSSRRPRRSRPNPPSGGLVYAVFARALCDPVRRRRTRGGPDRLEPPHRAHCGRVPHVAVHRQQRPSDGLSRSPRLHADLRRGVADVEGLTRGPVRSSSPSGMFVHESVLVIAAPLAGPGGAGAARGGAGLAKPATTPDSAGAAAGGVPGRRRRREPVGRPAGPADTAATRLRPLPLHRRRHAPVRAGVADDELRARTPRRRLTGSWNASRDSAIVLSVLPVAAGHRVRRHRVGDTRHAPARGFRPDPGQLRAARPPPVRLGHGAALDLHDRQRVRRAVDHHGRRYRVPCQERSFWPRSSRFPSSTRTLRGRIPLLDGVTERFSNPNCWRCTLRRLSRTCALCALRFAVAEAHHE